MLQAWQNSNLQSLGPSKVLVQKVMHWAWQDSNLQSPDPKSGALSIRPHAPYTRRGGVFWHKRIRQYMWGIIRQFYFPYFLGSCLRVRVLELYSLVWTLCIAVSICQQKMAWPEILGDHTFSVLVGWLNPLLLLKHSFGDQNHCHWGVPPSKALGSNQGHWLVNSYIGWEQLPPQVTQAFHT